MTHLLADWDNLTVRMEDVWLLICLDYDGTLTPIVSHPDLAELSHHRKQILKEVAGLEEVTVAIITGRSLKAIKQLVDIEGIIYVGNHGFELEGKGIHYEHPSSEDVKLLMRQIAVELEAIFAPFSGIYVEDKTYTLSVHYRQSTRREEEAALKLLRSALESYIRQERVVMRGGKKVWEIRPAIEWNKGNAALWLMNHEIKTRPSQVLPIYVGDDKTDEDAFRAFKGKGINVEVTSDAVILAEADYYVNSTEEVMDFLRRLKDVKKEKRYGITR